MKEFSITMALVDFIPVGLFAVAAIILQRDLYFKMSKGAFALFAAGTIDIIFAGFFKALYKLLYAAGVCDFETLSTLYFPMISVGFLLSGIALVAMIVHKQAENAAHCVAAPVLFNGTIIMIAFMIAGLAMIDTVLCILAMRLKKPIIVVLLIISFLCSLSMGYLSSKDFGIAVWNWIAQGINILGQGTFLISVLLLRKGGIVALKLH